MVNISVRLKHSRYKLNRQAHILVNYEKCLKCPHQACLTACPAQCYLPQPENGVVFNFRRAVPVTTKPRTPDPGLPAEQRLRYIFGGGLSRKQGEVITGPPEQLAERIIQFLRTMAKGEGKLYDYIDERRF